MIYSISAFLLPFFKLIILKCLNYSRFIFICRQSIDESDVKALIAFFETSQDMACVEDVLHMVIRAISQKSLMAAFVEQVNSIGGCHVFINLLQRYDIFTKSSEMSFVR